MPEKLNNLTPSRRKSLPSLFKVFKTKALHVTFKKRQNDEKNVEAEDSYQKSHHVEDNESFISRW